ncbi:MAG: hypothetical protein ABIG61_08090 [Planctomycetota bacterium]
MMKLLLDSQNVFDGVSEELRIGGWSRGEVQKSVNGLDGVLSIDLGKRSRKIKQEGVLRTSSKSALNNKIETISNFADGMSHILNVDDGRSFANIRVDSFEVGSFTVSGTGICCDYQIVYTQLQE